MSTPGAEGRVVVCGIGSEYRRDDGAGVVVARRVARGLRGVVDVGPLGEPLELLGRWDRCALAVVIDAIRSGAAPGSVVVADLDDQRAVRLRGATGLDRASTHGLGVAEVHRLSCALGSAPARLVLVGIEGEDFADGIGLSEPVSAAVDEAAALVTSIVRGAARCA